MNTFTPKQKAVSCVLKIVVIFSAILGTFLSAYAGRHSFMGGSCVFMYFTIQSNIAIAIITSQGVSQCLQIIISYHRRKVKQQRNA